MTTKNIFFTILLLTSFACQRQSDNASDKLLEEAAQIHMNAVEVEKKIKSSISQIEQERNQINIQGRALTPEEIQRVAQIESILASYDWFKDNHVEVPGAEHDHDHHDHDHDHDHDHGPGLELEPKDMLLVQQEFLDTILSIQKRIDLVLKK